MAKCERVKLVARGAVQGVGFRPFVYRLANELQLRGFISNSGDGVLIEAEGANVALRQFLLRLEKEKPPLAILQSVEASFLDPIGYEQFAIRESFGSGAKTALILPDLATCRDCLREIFQPNDRRFRYPFTNCTNCGPRFSIIEALPYDRANTSMKRFVMCSDCAREYADPSNRRFHAQPNACPRCGPQLAFLDSLGETIAAQNGALLEAAQAVCAGKILALKGLGGFQLLVDARNDEAVVRLRQRKHREEKPLAVMVSSIEEAREFCEVSDLEERLLSSPAAPIVLLRSRRALAPSIAPGNRDLGLLLPNTPLHHLFLREVGFPVVATSGNLSDEPICTDERDAVARLAQVADCFLVHDRPVVRPIDDSLARIMCDRELILRRARGFAPLPIALRHPVPTMLAVGAHLKNAIALSVGANVFVSQHLGDLTTTEAQRAFRAAASDLPHLYEATPESIVCDLHPDYLSTKFAREQSARCVPVQHHCAHIASCMAENEIDGPLLGVAWDGTGLGSDGTIWGGEFFLVEDASFKRAAHLRTFRLPGGEAAVREPRRVALGLLHELLGDELWPNEQFTAAFSSAEIRTLRAMLEKKINSPLTSSAGRLFDGVAALLGLCARCSFEGQAAMALEFAIGAETAEAAYGFELKGEAPVTVDWAPVIFAILDDLRDRQPVDVVAAKFHNGLADCIVAVARRFAQEKVVLSGGCFQNRYLTERTVQRLQTAGFRPYWHQRIPPNDGGIALGQICLASHA